ncbi:MAG: sugar phosphate isomerase/epimerase, partial [Candidatus Hydrogenedens sp.]|nr:sugar phosphate isomerase/epimerase [Candidatus Hydrogenedens sp.]
KAIGATSVLVVPDKVGDEQYYDDLYAKSQAVYREVIPYAQEQQILLLVENVWNNFLVSPLEMARYVDELDNPWLGAYFDAGNVLRYGWSEHWVRALGNRIKKIHIKDYSREKQEKEGLWKGFDVEIGEGSANWAAIRKELAAINFEGWATAEVGGGGRDRLAQVAAQMDKVLDL